MALTTETLTYWKVWERAFELGSFQLTVSSKEAATRMRFKLYSSAKAMLAGRIETEFPELFEIRQNCTVRMEPAPGGAGKYLIIVNRLDAKQELGVVLSALGLELDEVREQAAPPKAVSLNESEQRFAKMLLGVGECAPKTEEPSDAE